ncbi:helix-turn-helix domain-containing protein [Novosphingobium soli]|uniref:Helix-turn-helix domain-containing protein n=1 Tax=Novosphingobium soli TaxID=574956 RepID=A0ABV6CUV7_9SPHN
MENVETQGPAPSPQSAGRQLRAAREAAGLSRADVAARTKIAERHLIAIEEDRLGDLAGRTYAVGFARTYARAVGLDEQAIAARVRRQLDSEVAERPAMAPSFEPGDPARVPPRRIAWVAAIGVIVAIAVLLAFWSSFLSPQGELPDLIAQNAGPDSGQTAGPAAPAAPAAAPQPTPSAAPAGPVMLTATGDQVWVKVTDATGAQVLQKELAQGESWTAPAGSSGLQLRTGRPDALQISVGGKALPPLSDKPQLMSGVSLAAADLLARSAATAGAPAPAPATPAGQGQGGSAPAPGA